MQSRVKNGCTFLKKGEELNWDHSKLFPYFKSKIEPFLRNVHDSCFNMLDFFHSIRNYKIELTEEIEKNYEIFIDIYHYQQFIEVKEEIIAPIEVQLMWIVHCLNPAEYYQDCYKKYKKLLDVNINTLPFEHNNDDDMIPYLNEFEEYLKDKLSKNVLERLSSISTTATSIDINENPQNWFIRHLHMKNSILLQIEFMNKINYIQYNKRFHQKEIYKAMHRYLKFLYLMALPMNKRPLICIPTIDIELIWHSHILNINDYYALSKYLFPDIHIIPYNLNISHDDNNKNKIKTQQVWNTIFGDDDYLQGRSFYIDSQSKDTKPIKLKRPKPPIVLQIPDGRYPVTCSVPSQSPGSQQTSSYLITPIPDTAYDERDFGEEDDGENYYGEQEEKIIEQIPLEIETSDTKDINIPSETENCCYINCELCKDCCLWTFKIHRNENICIICGIIICVGLIIAMIGGLIFSSINDGINNITVNLYQNDIIINKDSTITINNLIVWDLDENQQFNFQKSISYQIDNIETDIIDFNAGYNDYNNYFVGEAYLNNDTNGNNDNSYYYIDMTMNAVSNKNTICTVNFNYTLSSSYFCCNSNECDEIGLFMPWINKWQYPSNIKQFDINIFYQDLNAQIYSSWDDRNIKKERNENEEKEGGIFYLSTNNIDRDKNFNLYFKLLDNDTMNLNIGNTQKRCSEQIKYFIYDRFVYKENENHSTITSNDFFLISLLTILFIACSCYGCWWIMYFLDNSFFCDLCDII